MNATYGEFVVVADFNSDGRPDLAVTGEPDTVVAILLGNAPPNAGTLQPMVGYHVGNIPRAIAVGDFNADSYLDLAVTTQDGVAILLGNAPPNAGTFQPAVIYNAGDHPFAIAAGDFDGDGGIDLAVTNFVINRVSILIGNRDGTFHSAGSYATGPNPRSIALGDFNSDGRPDLAVANYNGALSILLSNLDGTFQPKVDYNTGTHPYGVAVGDFNGDGRPDVAVANYGSNDVSILICNSGGTFQSALNYNGLFAPENIAVGDFNADGVLDLVVANGNSYNVSILTGNGPPSPGTFAAPINFVVTDNSPLSVAVGDLDSDGRPDVVAGNNPNVYGGNATVLLNRTLSLLAPTITHAPVDVAVHAGQGATFSVIADGHGNSLSYQWRKDGIPLADTGRISGATTPMLTFRRAVPHDSGTYDVQISASACTGGSLVTVSPTATLTVTHGHAGGH